MGRGAENGAVRACRIGAGMGDYAVRRLVIWHGVNGHVIRAGVLAEWTVVLG